MVRLNSVSLGSEPDYDCRDTGASSLEKKLVCTFKDGVLPSCIQLHCLGADM